MREPNIDQIIDNHGNNFIYLTQTLEDEETKLVFKRLIDNESTDTVSTIEKFTLTADEADSVVNVLLSEGFGDEEDITEIITSNRPVLCSILKEEFKSDAKFPSKDKDTRTILKEYLRRKV